MIDAEDQKKAIQLQAHADKARAQRAQAKLHVAKQMSQIIQVTIGTLSVDDDNAISTLLQNFVGVAVFRGSEKEQILKLVSEQWDYQAKLKAQAEENAKKGEGPPVPEPEPLIVAPGA